MSNAVDNKTALKGEGKYFFISICRYKITVSPTLTNNGVGGFGKITIIAGQTETINKELKKHRIQSMTIS